LDPKDYRWSGYGAAMGGRKGAKVGMQTVVKGLLRGREESLTRSLEVYRKYLYLEGDERRDSLGPDGRVTRGALDAKAVEEVLRRKGRLPVSEYGRCRVRYFCDGLVLGGREAPGIGKALVPLAWRGFAAL
jgi:hypothetical protein